MNKPLLTLILTDLLLVAITLIRFPAAGLANAAPAIVLLLLCAAALRWLWPRLQPPARAWALRLGAAAGLVLGGEMLLEYLLLPSDNSAYGLVEYALFLLLLAASGWMSYRAQRSLKASAQAGAWTGIIGSLIWYGVVLLVFHLFWGTARQAQVFQAEGNLVDFARSGMQDFAAFIAQDFFGAGFFHLLLGGVLGGVLGWVGGLGGKMTARGKILTK